MSLKAKKDCLEKCETDRGLGAKQIKGWNIQIEIRVH